MSVLIFHLFFFGQTVFCEYYIRDNIFTKIRAGRKMSNMIKKVSRDHEDYEVDSADKIMVYSRLGKLYTDEELKEIDADKLAVIKNVCNDMNTESNGIDDIIIRNSCYYESRFAGDYRLIRRIIRIEGQRVAD